MQQLPIEGESGLRRVWRLAHRLNEDITSHNLSIIAAGMAYNAIFSLFPAMAALISLYGLFADPQIVAGQVQSLARFAPGDVAHIVGDQLNHLATTSRSGLGLSLAVSLGVALFSVGSGVKVMIAGLNVAYGAKEDRGFFTLWSVAIAMAVWVVMLALLVLGLAAVLPVVEALIGLGGAAGLLASILRWPVVAVLTILSLDVLYRFGPCRRGARWRWISWGTGLCTLAWLLGSVVLSVYVSNFGKYDQAYGSLGGALVLLLWLYFSSFTILLGAEVDAELEQQHGVAVSRESSHTARADRQGAS